MTTQITGGCQCGAVRYSLSEAPRSTVCHCRMCQRAVGGLFAALAQVPRSALTWTRGEPALYASSNIAHRGYCRDCGTPLTFGNDDADKIEVTTGSLDDPDRFPMTEHFGVESRLGWVHLNEGLPESRTGDNPDYPANAPGFRSRQGDA